MYVINQQLHLFQSFSIMTANIHYFSIKNNVFIVLCSYTKTQNLVLVFLIFHCVLFFMNTPTRLALKPHCSMFPFKILLLFVNFILSLIAIIILKLFYIIFIFTYFVFLICWIFLRSFWFISDFYFSLLINSGSITFN